MKSSDTSAKYSWPSREQNDDIHDSGAADSEEDMVVVEVVEWRELEVPCEAIVRCWTPAIADRTPLADTVMLV